MSLWEVHPRDADLGRTLDPVSGWTELTVVERYNEPDTWVLVGPAEVLSGFTPGMGAILDRDGEQVSSGQLRSIARTAEADEQTGQWADVVTLGFVSDLDELWTRRVYPDPAHVLTEVPSTFGVSYDARTGTVEDLILAYVGAHLGPVAPQLVRRQPALYLPASEGRGGSASVRARMDSLGTLAHDLAEAGGLHVKVVHDESTGTPRLALSIGEVVDVSDHVRFGPADTAATGAVTSWGYSLTAPELTTAVLFSAGELTAREATAVADVDAQDLWGRRRESLVDQRQTDDPDEIVQAGVKALAEGATQVSTSFTVADGPDVVYRRDYAVGYVVGVELPGLPGQVSDDVVREVTTTVSPDEPERVDIVVGSPGATSASTKQAQQLAKALRRINLLERST